jgi:probable HAF family extracellular repeat protein
MFAVGFAFGAPDALAQPSFSGLGSLPGAIPGSVVGGISGDGLVVAGGCASAASCEEAWRWSEGTGMVALGFLPGQSSSAAVAASHDGAVLFGISGDSLFRWTSSGMVAIGATLPTGPGVSLVASDLSSDGLVAIGNYLDFFTFQGASFRWTSGVGIEILEPFTIPNVAQFAALSADGSVIVGGIGVPDDLSAISRTDAGTVFLPELPLGSCQCGSDARGVSSDGATVVGTSHQNAFRWTAASGIQALAGPPQVADFDAATDVSSDGSVVVGYTTDSSGTRAFIWTEAGGMRDLHFVLTLLGLDVAGWELTGVVGISDDGQTLTGNGINPAGDEEAWIATIPSLPALPALHPIGALLLCSLISAGGARVARRQTGRNGNR